MSGEIILNLDSPEYQDEFHSSEESHEQNGLWQQDANETLVHLLNKMGEEAKRYKNVHVGNEISPKKFSSYHHAIFISGARGTGKTVFYTMPMLSGRGTPRNPKNHLIYILLM